MADRLKRLRESRNLSHDRLSQTIAEQYKEYGVSISRDSLINYEKANDKNLGMRAECLRCLADFYGVSTDYLLGISDEKTPDTNARAVIAYTGLSEDNVLTLHHMKENASEFLVIDEVDNHIEVDGCKPFLDCLNDLLDAVYSDKETVINFYTRMKQETLRHKEMDFWYLDDGVMLNCQSSHSIVSGNEYVEYACMKIAREIENFLKKKYIATDSDAYPDGAQEDE